MKKAMFVFDEKLAVTITTSTLEIHTDEKGKIKSVHMDKGAKEAFPYFNPEDLKYVFVEKLPESPKEPEQPNREQRRQQQYGNSKKQKHRR